MVQSWPPDVITSYGIQVLQDGIEPQITFVSHDGEQIFYLLGGLAPIAGVTEGVVLSEGVAGLHAPFNQLSQKGARQVGVTLTDTVYDPTQMTMKVKAVARTRDRLRAVISNWMASWPPEKQGTLSWVTPDSGEWWCNVRPSRGPTEKLDYFPGVRSQDFTWIVQNPQAMWNGPDSTSQFGFAFHDSHDDFNRYNVDSLGANWVQTYSSTAASPVTIDSGGSGTVGTTGGTPAVSKTATCSYARGASANYVIADVAFQAGINPFSVTVTYGSSSMSLLGQSTSGVGGIAFFGLQSPPSGAQTVTATVQSLGTVAGVAVACASFIGWGQTVFTPAPLDSTGFNAGGAASNPSQSATAVPGDLVVWGVCNVTGSNIDATISNFNQTALQNTGPISLTLADEMAMLLGYAPGGQSEDTSATPFSAQVAQPTIGQWWSAATLTLVPPGAIGDCGTDGSKAVWTPNGTVSGSVINRWLGQNAIQTVTLGGSPTSFTLTYNGETTTAITTPTTAATVQSALQSLIPAIGTGNVSVTTPVIFDAVGIGASPAATATSISWQHISTGNYALAFVSVASGSVTSVTYGGTPMTLLTSQAFNNVTGNGYLYVYGLASLPGGARQVVANLTAATYATGNSITYGNVASAAVLTPSVYGNSSTCTMPTSTGSRVVVQAFGSDRSALGQTGGGTLRYHGFVEELSFLDYAGLQIVEGTEGHTFSASLPVAQDWAGVAIALTPATATSSYGPFAVEFTGTLATQKVLPLTGATVGGTNAYLSVAQTRDGMFAVSATDNQIISAQFGTFYTWPFNDGAYVDLWARWDGNQTSPTGIRLRISVGQIILSRFNAGVETVMNSAFDLLTPFPQDTYTLICGTPTNSRIYKLQVNGLTIFQFTEVDSGSAIGPSYRHSGFGMTAGLQFGIFTGQWSQAPPPTVDNWSFADNATVTESGTIPLTNFGDLEEFPDYLVYGPGTFTFGNGPGVDPTISFGPLADNQIALLRTNPSYRGVYDLSFAASEQVLNSFQSFVEDLYSLAFNYNIPPLVSWWESLFGITPQQGNMYSLLNGRWDKGIPARPTGGTPPTYETKVTITDGDASSQIVAAITPRRRWPE